MAHETNERRLIALIQQGNVEDMGRMLTNAYLFGGININAKVNGQSILNYAAVTGNIEVIYLLLAQANIVITLDSIEGAVQGGNAEIVSLLLAQSNLHITSSIVDLAVRAGNVDIASLILAHPHVEIDEAIVLDAAQFSTPDMLLLLVENKGVSPYKLNIHGKSSLMLAVEWGCKASVELLIEKKVKVIQRDIYQYDALRYAIHRARNNQNEESFGILTVLLQQGAAFCRDLPSLESITPPMNHYEGCYFFDTTMEGQLINAQTPGFESATFITIDNEKHPANINHSVVIQRCEELLKQINNSEQKKRLHQLQRCSRFISGEITLSRLCLEQVARQQYGMQNDAEIRISAEHIPDNLREDYEKFQVTYAKEDGPAPLLFAILAFTTYSGGLLSACAGIPMWASNAPMCCTPCAPCCCCQTVNMGCFYTGAVAFPACFIVSSVGYAAVCMWDGRPMHIQMSAGDDKDRAPAIATGLSTLSHRFFQRVFKKGEKTNVVVAPLEEAEMLSMNDDVVENEISDDNELLLMSSERFRNG